MSQQGFVTQKRPLQGQVSAHGNSGVRPTGVGFFPVSEVARDTFRAWRCILSGCTPFPRGGKTPQSLPGSPTRAAVLGLQYQKPTHSGGVGWGWGIKTTRIHPLTVWRPEVQNQGVRGHTFSEAPASSTSGEAGSLGLWLSFSPLHLPPLPVSPVSLHPHLFLQGHPSLDLGPTLLQSDLILTSAVTLFPDKAGLWGSGPH